MIKLFATTLTALALFSGCSSKSYFSPKKVDSNLGYRLDLKTPLFDVSRDGATYDDGRVITKKRGMLKYAIPKGFRFVYDAKNAILIADASGEAKILSNGKVVFEHKFDTAIASGSIKGDIGAFVLSNNKLIIYNISQNKVIYEEELEPTFAHDSRVANPIFLNNKVVFPTLDGRLLIVDKDRKTILRDISLSDRELFNNVIFLQEKNNTIVAATAFKVIVLRQHSIKSKRADIKDIIFDSNYIYIFTKSGKVIKTDLNLKTIKEIKFDFANFSAISANDKLYMVEKGGYLISMDKNLQNSQISKLPTDIEKSIFSFKNKLFLDRFFIELK
jgi:outer membrane protein assembly factor BamB